MNHREAWSRQCRRQAHLETSELCRLMNMNTQVQVNYTFDVTENFAGVVQYLLGERGSVYPVEHQPPATSDLLYLPDLGNGESKCLRGRVNGSLPEHVCLAGLIKALARESRHSNYFGDVANCKQTTDCLGHCSCPMSRAGATLLGRGFTECIGLVLVEFRETMADAILREKRIKKCRRTWKLEFIEGDNRAMARSLRPAGATALLAPCSCQGRLWSPLARGRRTGWSAAR